MGQYGGMKITRFGHAALLVETDTTRVLVDPGVFCGDDVFALTDLNAIVITHQHADHLDQKRAPGLLANNLGALLLCDPETAGVVEFGSWTVNGKDAEHQVGDLMLRGVGERHAVILPSIPQIANIGVLISDGTTTLFHPGDTYEHAPSEVDVLALPLGAPWAKVSETVNFVQRVAPATLFPIHDRTISDVAYPMYWGHVSNYGGVADARLLGQGESTEA